MKVIKASENRVENIVRKNDLGQFPDKKVIEDSKVNIHCGIKSESGKMKKIVLYMPTFRESETKFFKVFDVNEFKNFLHKENILFCIKLHPKSKLCRRFKEIEGENILIINADADPYVFLKYSDMLITDYSSIYFDYLLLDRPVVFFAYDLDEYMSQSREMYFNYEDFTPGEKAHTMEQLQNCILNAFEDIDTRQTGKYREKRQEIREKVFKYTDRSICRQLVDEIKNILS